MMDLLHKNLSSTTISIVKELKEIISNKIFKQHEDELPPNKTTN